MVSIGTVLTLGIVAAIAAGGYAVYRNADKIGGALSRGVETNLTNPIGNYFDSLWSNAQSSFGVAPGQPGQGVNPGTIFNPLPPASGQPTPKPTPVPVPQYNYPGLPPSYQNPPASNLPNPNYPTPSPTPEPKPTIVKSGQTFSEGWYYINYKGSEFDTQWKLGAAQAKQTAKAAAAPGDWLYNIKYIGKSKLGAAGFETFGKSQNYL